MTGESGSHSDRVDTFGRRDTSQYRALHRELKKGPSLLIQERRLRHPASEPVAAVGHPPAEDADGNGSQQRPQDGQGEIRNQSEHDKGSPEDLTLHFTILARTSALWSPVKALVSRKKQMPGQNDAGRSNPSPSKNRRWGTPIPNEFIFWAHDSQTERQGYWKVPRFRCCRNPDGRAALERHSNAPRSP